MPTSTEIIVQFSEALQEFEAGITVVSKEAVCPLGIALTFLHKVSKVCPGLIATTATILRTTNDSLKEWGMATGRSIEAVFGTSDQAANEKVFQNMPRLIDIGVFADPPLHPNAIKAKTAELTEDPLAHTFVENLLNLVKVRVSVIMQSINGRIEVGYMSFVETTDANADLTDDLPATAVATGAEINGMSDDVLVAINRLFSEFTERVNALSN